MDDEAECAGGDEARSGALVVVVGADLSPRCCTGAAAAISRTGSCLCGMRRQRVSQQGCWPEQEQQHSSSSSRLDCPPPAFVSDSTSRQGWAGVTQAQHP